MLDLKKLEKNEADPVTGTGYLDDYRTSLKNRGGDLSVLDQILELNKKRKEISAQTESSKAEQNRVGQEIVKLKKSGEDASHLLEQMQKISGQNKEMLKSLETAQAELNDLALGIPNRLHHTVPVGTSEDDNVTTREVGEKPDFKFKVKDHVDLAEKLNLINFERAGKVTGARFAFMLGSGARLERALIQYMMDLHSNEHGYTEMIPPFMVNTQSMIGTGQFPKFSEDVFHLQDTDYHLIPTAETSVTNYFAGELLKEEELPQSFCAFSPCFRSEAGSHGKDTRGIYRVHQFNKVELLHFAHPDTSYELHEKLTGHAEKVLKDLGLHYRVVNKCTADMTFSSAKCYDLEVWLPGRDAYGEISSCSNFEDFQARRANIRFRPAGPKAKPRFVHTINGSGLAIGRTIIAIMENFQQEDGKIAIPEVLQPYMGGKKSIG